MSRVRCLLLPTGSTSCVRTWKCTLVKTRDRPELIRPVQVQEEFELVGNGVRGRNNLVVVDRMALNAALSFGDFLIDGGSAYASLPLAEISRNSLGRLTYVTSEGARL